VPPRVIRTKSQVRDLPTLQEITSVAVQKFATDDRNRAIVEPRQQQHRSQMEAYASSYGVRDAKGHRKVYFAEPQEVGGSLARGFVRERRVSHYLDEEAAKDLAVERGCLEMITETVTTTVIKQDGLYAAQQLGYFTPEELRSLFKQTVTYSIKRL
jgi:hypothetical protein